MAAQGIATVARLVTGFVTGIPRVVAAVVRMGAQILSALASIAAQAFNAGRQIVQRIAQGIMASIGAVVNAAKAVGRAVMSVLPNSPVPTGPLTVLNNPATSPGAKIVDMLSAGIMSRAGQLSNTLGQTLTPATSPAGLFTGPTAGVESSGGNNTFSITINVSSEVADQAVTEDHESFLGNSETEVIIQKLSGRYAYRVIIHKLSG